MIVLKEVVESLHLSAVTDPDESRAITGAYASDLLSCVMARAKAGYVWITLQAHPNVVAVASLLDLAAVIITEGVMPGQETTRKAQEEQVTLLTTPKDTFTIAGELTILGIKGGFSTHSE